VDAVIAVEGLVKRYGSLVALDGIDLQVSRGTVFGLLGPNGAGKTTAVRVLTTIIRPDGGRASVLTMSSERPLPSATALGWRAKTPPSMATSADARTCG